MWAISLSVWLRGSPGWDQFRGTFHMKKETKVVGVRQGDVGQAEGSGSGEECETDVQD